MNQILRIKIKNPVSKKNKMQYGNGRVWKKKSVDIFENDLYLLAIASAREQGWVETMNAVHVSIAYDAKNNTALLTVTDTGKPAVARKKDLQNLPDTICDILQRACIYADDKQISRIEVYDEQI